MLLSDGSDQYSDEEHALLEDRIGLNLELIDSLCEFDDGLADAIAENEFFLAFVDPVEGAVHGGHIREAPHRLLDEGRVGLQLHLLLASDMSGWRVRCHVEGHYDVCKD